MKNACILLLATFAFLTPSGAENLAESSAKAATVAASPDPAAGSDASGSQSPGAPADEIAELRRVIQEKDEEIKRLGDDLALSRKEVELLESELDVLRDQLGVRDPRIVWVNPDWDFVLVDHGGRSAMYPGQRAYVHRGTNFVGSITITNVQETISIAEINPADRAPGLTIQVGDDMFFPPRSDAGSGDRKPAR